MKKIVCIILTLLLIASCFSFSAYAASGITASKVNKYLQQGEKLSLSVDFNTDAISNAFQYDIEYDTSVLRLLSVSGGSYNEYADGKIRYVAVGNSKTDNAVFVFVLDNIAVCFAHTANKAFDILNHQKLPPYC